MLGGAVAWIVGVTLAPPAAAQWFPEFVSKVERSAFRQGVAEPLGKNGVTLLKGVLVANPSRWDVLEAIGYSDGWVSALYTVRIPNPLEGLTRGRPMNVGTCYFQAKDLNVAVDSTTMLEYARGNNPYGHSFRQRIDNDIVREGGRIIGRVDHFEAVDRAGEIIYWSYPGRTRSGKRFTIFHRSEELVMMTPFSTVHVVVNCETSNALSNMKDLQNVSITYSNRVW